MTILESGSKPESGGETVVAPHLYEYRLADSQRRELLVYHWHPGLGGVGYPHLHVSAALDVQVDAISRRSIDLDKLHIVTGRVALAEFIHMLITEFQVRPLRPDWEARLEGATPH